jgi:DNA repair exonuclease SbcCD nuclease subunit
LKFIHTADWQLGMKAAHVGEAAASVREERLAAARRVVGAARDQGAEFILMAGDTFEDNGVERALIQKVADILGSSRVPVYLIPGNHDPLTPGSVWEHPAWKSMEHVHVLREEKPVDIPGGVLYPCPVTDKRSRKDPTAWIAPENTRAIRIGLAHGSVEGIPQPEPDHPIPRDAALRAGLDYLVLGHWHSTAMYPAHDGSVRMAHCGTHEPTSFGERDSGNVLVVEIAGPGASPLVTPVRTGGLDWMVIEKDIREPGDLLRVRQDIESHNNPGSTLVELRLKGLLAASERGELAHIQDIMASSRFLFARVDGSGLRPSPEDSSWLASVPPGILQNVAARLQELSDPRFAGERPEGASPDVASRSLMELYALMTEVQP